MNVLLYDGHCRICSQAARQLKRLDASRTLKLISFREEGALAAFPNVQPERCERAIQLVESDGRVYEGAEALVRLLQGRWFGFLAKAYYLPGIRQLSDGVYSVIARYRFRIAGRNCPDGACSLHMS